jgi:hypothetical protein
MVIFQIIKLVHYCPIRFHFEILFSPERRLGGGAPPIATDIGAMGSYSLHFVASSGRPPCPTRRSFIEG